MDQAGYAATQAVHASKYPGTDEDKAIAESIFAIEQASFAATLPPIASGDPEGEFLSTQRTRLRRSGEIRRLGEAFAGN
ncbi:MAG: hypothetical protein U1D30_17590 [Planctomycetota bacterium]